MIPHWMVGRFLVQFIFNQNPFFSIQSLLNDAAFLILVEIKGENFFKEEFKREKKCLMSFIDILQPKNLIPWQSIDWTFKGFQYFFWYICDILFPCDPSYCFY